jgi:1-acyl-sn-glycerol-3-phosphate acyltransferase
MSSRVYWLATWIAQYLLLPIYARITVKGLENVPMQGPLIIASNHLNDADPGVISTRIRRRMVYMTKSELFKVPILKQFLTAFGTIPVHRYAADLAAVRQATQVLQQGLALCIFPEGTRSGEEARLMRAWPGAGLIALRNDVPILPIAITGSQKLGLPKLLLRPFRRYKVTLTVGEPFHLPAPTRINAEAAQEGTQRIMEKIAALLPPEYRGYYGDAPDGPYPDPLPEGEGIANRGQD